MIGFNIYLVSLFVVEYDIYLVWDFVDISFVLQFLNDILVELIVMFLSCSMVLSYRIIHLYHFQSIHSGACNADEIGLITTFDHK